MPNSASDDFNPHTLHVAKHCWAIWREAFAFSRIAIAAQKRLQICMEENHKVSLASVLAELEFNQSHANDNPT